jgi:hypothetical protein
MLRGVAVDVGDETAAAGFERFLFMKQMSLIGFRYCVYFHQTWCHSKLEMQQL